MKPADKRFWIFEGFTLLYAIALMILDFMAWGHSAAGTLFFFVGSCCTSGWVTFLIANGKHWLVFGLVYEVIYLLLLFMYLLADGWMSGYFDEEYLDMCLAFIYPIAIVSLFPSLALAFVGYHLFNENREKKK